METAAKTQPKASIVSLQRQEPRDSSSNPSKRKTGIVNAHWQTTGLLGGALVLGILSAVIHDTVYAHFAGKPVKSTTQQEWLGRVGTGLAFLVRTLFSAAVGTACVQRLWWILRNHSTSIQTIDSSFIIVHNPFTLVNLKLFREAPLIIGLAMISWYAVTISSARDHTDRST
jgi:hypothetical protein